MITDRTNIMQRDTNTFIDRSVDFTEDSNIENFVCLLWARLDLQANTIKENNSAWFIENVVENLRSFLATLLGVESESGAAINEVMNVLIEGKEASPAIQKAFEKVINQQKAEIEQQKLQKKDTTFLRNVWTVLTFFWTVLTFFWNCLMWLHNKGVLVVGPGGVLVVGAWSVLVSVLSNETVQDDINGGL